MSAPLPPSVFYLFAGKTVGFPQHNVFNHEACVCLPRKACSPTSTLRRTVHVLTFRICHLASSNKAANAARLVGSLLQSINNLQDRVKEDKTIPGDEDST